MQTDVGTINMATPSVTYKPSIPKIYNFLTSLFVSASIYYTTSFHSYFHRDYNNIVTLNGGFDQGIVYSSDMSLNSCYTVYEIAASGPFPLSTFGINSIATSIYEPSTITFNNDPNAYTTVDII
jgi:hypothetical protein